MEVTMRELANSLLMNATNYLGELFAPKQLHVLTGHRLNQRDDELLPAGWLHDQLCPAWHVSI